MEAYSTSMAPCEGDPLVTGRFTSQRASNAGFDVFFDASLNNGWANSREQVTWDAVVVIVTSL